MQTPPGVVKNVPPATYSTRKLVEEHDPEELGYEKRVRVDGEHGIVVELAD